VVGGGIAPARRRRFAVVTASNDVSEGQMLSRPRRKTRSGRRDCGLTTINFATP
jgi:hypothetical protein